MNSDHLDTAIDTVKADYQAGQAAFERGEYRKSIQHLEAARSAVNLTSRLGGEVQIWLVTAYEAAGRRSDAIDLCRKVSRHPDLQARKQGKRLLYILEAPQLKTRPEWLTQIPDMTSLSDSDRVDRRGASTSTTVNAPTKPAFQLESIDLSQVSTQDNRFIWFALASVVLVLCGLLWLA